MKIVMVVEKDNKRFGYALTSSSEKRTKALFQALEGCKILSIKVK